MAYLLQQPPEVLHGILVNIDPADLAAVNRTCQHFREFIANDYLLWKRQYLKRFDCPSSCEGADWLDISWQDRLKDLVSLQKILQSNDDDLKKSDESLFRIATTVISLLMTSNSRPVKNTSFLTTHFQSPSNISSFLCRSSLFTHARYPTDIPSPSPSHRQLSAQLHVYYGLEIEPTDPYPSLRNTVATSTNSAMPIHPYARARVYDLRRYTAANLWGPFLDDGSERVDWEKVQAILIDLLYNLRTHTERLAAPASASSPMSQLWNCPFRGLAPHSYESLPLPGPLAPDSNPELTARDPYGVTGTWMRIVCFLDYNHLYAFNFETPAIPLSEDRDPIETKEAFRLIKLQLRVTRIEFDDDARGEAVGTPIVHFEGKSKSTYTAWDQNANSRIRGECWKTVGTVRTTPSGHIRWTTFSIFHGEERWRSEGVQIGGIRSARGILGNWFDKDFDLHGPAGPTMFWKISDDIQQENPRFPGTQPHFVEPDWHEVVRVLLD